MDLGSDPDRARVEAFHRMRALATGLLAAMAVVFLAASLAQGRWPAAAWVRAFAEAAMVGACADWFAVTALFRRPFGLPIPHTGIVPRNKDRIGEALGAFIADNFLTEPVLAERLRRIELARWGGEWIGDEANARRLAAALVGALPDVLDALPPRALRTLVGSAAIAALRVAPAADIASKALAFAWSEGRAQAVIERGAGLLRDYLDARREVILEAVQAQSYRWLPSFVDKMIARKITDGVIQLLGEIRDPAHPWRLQLDETVQGWAQRLIDDPEWRARAEEIKLRLLEDERLARGLDDVWSQLEQRLSAQVRDNPEALVERVAKGLVAGGAWLRENETVRSMLNAWSSATIRGVIAPRRHEIGRFVAAVVAEWDAEMVVEKLEQQVGRDLQYIRINGTLVGGLVGLIIYAVSRLFGL